MSVSLKGHLCTPYVCVVKGSPVHHTSVSLSPVISVHLLLRGHLIKSRTRHIGVWHFKFTKGALSDRFKFSRVAKDLDIKV